MPSKIYNNAADDVDSTHSNEFDDVSALEPSNIAHSAEITLPTDEIEAEKMDNLLDDGHLVVKSVKVVKSGSKISTEFSKGEVDSNALPARQGEVIGKKHTDTDGTNLDKLRRRFGSNWKQTSRKIALVALVIGILGVVGVSAIAAWAVDIWNNTSPIDSQPVESSVVYARDGKTELFKFYKEEKREVVPICGPDESAGDNCIPEKMQLAIIALEDENFYYNEDGIPWRNIIGAGVTCITSAGDNCRGGSGLSQQLVKNVTKDDEASVQRKARELFTSIKLNQEKNKKDILSLYLNQVPFGRNAYGVQEAARSFFGVNIKDITVPQACYLAALVQQPSKFSSSIGQPDSAAWKEYDSRKNSCLEKMHTKKLEGDKSDYYIKTADDLKNLQQTQVEFVKTSVDYPYPHFRDYITEELKKFNISEQALYTRGYQIITTLDPNIQQITEKSIKDNEKDNILGNGANNAAALVLDGPSGEILAMVGSRDYNNADIDGQVNVVTSPQQPGSSFKPYVYTTAFQQNFNPATVLVDAPTDFGGGFRPKNYSGTFSGPVTIRNALQGSLNIPAVKAAVLAAGTGQGNLPDGIKGINKVFDTAEAMGLKFPCIPSTDGADVCNDPSKASEAYRNRCFLGSAIGGCEVTMLSHATGINTLAQDGNLRTATPFISIKDTKSGIDIYQRRQASDDPVYPKKDKVVDPLIAREVTNVLTDYAARYPIFGRRLASNLELEGWTGANAIAAKTGTTDQVRDTWTVGYTPYYTVTTWVGNTDNSPMKDTATGSSAAAFVWHQIMNDIHKDKEKKGFTTDGLQSVTVDPTTGLLDPNSKTREWMTPNQVKALEDAGTRLSKPDYNPQGESIFNNRSAVISRTLKVNKLDNKIAVDGKTLPENTTDLKCTELISEFPAAQNWFAPADAIAQKNPDKYQKCPSDLSDQDQVANQNSKPDITSNAISGGTVNGAINANALPTGTTGKTITAMELFINGTSVATSTNGTLIYTITSADVGPGKTLKITATDNLGASSEKIIDNVTLSTGPAATITPPNPAVLSVSSTGVVTLNATSTSALNTAGLVFVLTQGGITKTCSPVTVSTTSYKCVWASGISGSGFTAGPAILSFRSNAADLDTLNLVLAP